jgi:hypothetical protein
VIKRSVLRSPETGIIRAPATRSPSPIGTSANPQKFAHEVEETPSADLFRGVSPRRSIVEDGGEFRWKTVPHSRYYEIHVVTSEGDLVWEGQSEASVLRPPADLRLNDGSYFVWITAYLESGREAKSAPVKFSLASSR